MSVFSELAAQRQEGADSANNEVTPFTLDAKDVVAESDFDDEEAQQAEAEAAQAALSKLNEAEKKKAAEHEKRRAHEEAEAKRKAEWEAKQAEKKAAVAKALEELLTMSDDDVMGSALKRTGADLERLTRRNMKMCVTEHIQTLCLDNPVFARLVCHPKKNMVNCFQYINKKAEDYVKKELELLGEKAVGTVGEDVPDDLCYQWAEDYFRDPDAEVDQDKDEKFVPKPYSGISSSSSKSKKKEPAKPKAKPAPKKETEQPVQQQLSMTMGV